MTAATPRPGVCRYCGHAAGDLLEVGGEQVAWLDATRTVCMYPKCMIEHQAADREARRKDYVNLCRKRKKRRAA